MVNYAYHDKDKLKNKIKKSDIIRTQLMISTIMPKSKKKLRNESNEVKWCKKGNRQNPEWMNMKWRKKPRDIEYDIKDNERLITE